MDADDYADGLVVSVVKGKCHGRELGCSNQIERWPHDPVESVEFSGPNVVAAVKEGKTYTIIVGGDDPKESHGLFGLKIQIHGSGSEPDGDDHDEHEHSEHDHNEDGYDDGTP